MQNLQDTRPDKLINEALLHNQGKRLKHTHTKDHHKALFEIVQHYLNHFGTLHVWSWTDTNYEQMNLYQSLPSRSADFDLVVYTNELSQFFQSPFHWSNGRYLQEEHIAIIFYQEIKRFTNISNITLELPCKKYEYLGSDVGYADLFAKNETANESIVFEIKLLTFEDLLTPIGIDTIINPEGKRKYHIEKGYYTISDLLQGTMKQVCNYNIIGTNIRRVAIVVTPLGLFHLEKKDAYSYWKIKIADKAAFIKELSKIPDKEIKAVLYSKSDAVCILNLANPSKEILVRNAEGIPQELLPTVQHWISAAEFFGIT